MIRRAPLSIVIPTLNPSLLTLSATIQSLMPAVRSDLIRELIISDADSDGMVEFAKEIGAKLIVSQPSRGHQLHQGALLAEGDWLMFLHADTQLAGSWSETVWQHIRSSQDAAYFRLRFSTSGWAASWVAAWANFRSRWLGLPYGDQGLLISKELYDYVGGYKPVAIMEDVMMAQKLKNRLRMLECEAITNSIRYQEDGWFKRGGLNLLLLLRFLTGASPQSLVNTYQTRPKNRQTAP